MNVVSDLKIKKVFSIHLIILSSLNIIFWTFYNKKILINCLIGYTAVVITFLIISFISKDGIGLGDMFYIGFFSTLYGYFFTAIAFLLSFWIGTLVLIIPFFLGKIDRKTRIPFIPFLFAGCTLSIVIGYINTFFS